MTLTDAPRDGLSIAAVERETGFSKDTLRVWERRYGFPSPSRDASGERSYPPEQVEKLQLIRKLMAGGHRPGKLTGIDTKVLRAMSAAPRREGTGDEDADAGGTGRPDLIEYVALCKAHRVDELRSELTQRLLRLGMYRFVTEVVAPLNAEVGAEWASGRLAVFEEHLYTESVQVVMRNAIAAIPPQNPEGATARSPRVLLTTIPQEPHALGLLMAESILALEGAHCISLGVQTPVKEIARAARAQQADIVALSFSGSIRPAVVLEALADLRAALPAATEIWAGGRNMAFGKRTPAGARYLELHSIPVALEDWRKRGGDAL